MVNQGNDLKISGAGSANGGIFNQVKISGAGTITSDMECNELKTSGASEMKGNVKTKSFKASGASKVNGNLISDEVSVSGSAKFNGNITTVQFKASGSIEVGKKLQAEKVKISGSLNIGEDCEAEHFLLRGAFKVGGLLNADDIDIILYGGCRVREMGGERINIRQSKFDLGLNIIKTLFGISDYFEAEIIEGDEIYLERTKAKIVRGKNVEIGPGCEIELVEYKEKIEISKGANVKGHKKV